MGKKAVGQREDLEAELGLRWDQLEAAESDLVYLAQPDLVQVFRDRFPDLAHQHLPGRRHKDPLWEIRPNGPQFRSQR